MEVRLCVLSDYATVSQEGIMYLVTMFEASPVEANSNKQLRFVLAGADGGEILAVEQTVTVPQTPLPGKPVLMNHVLAFAGIEFRKSGDYAFHVLIGGEEKTRAPLFVHQPTGATK